MGPECHETDIDLLDVGRLLNDRLRLEHRGWHVGVDLGLELLFDVRPEQAQEVAWVSLSVEVPILVQVDIVEQGLAGVDLGLIVVTFHEDVEEGLRCIEGEDPLQVDLRIVHIFVLLNAVYLEVVVECDDDLVDGDADIPDDLGRGGATLELVADDIDDATNLQVDLTRIKQAILFVVIFLLTVNSNQLLDDKAEGSQ